MSIKLSKGEQVVRSYDYATVGTTGVASQHGVKNLTVTNKRIIHREACSGAGNESMRTSEMPVSAAKYITTNYGKKSYPMLLVIGILIALLSFAAFALTLVVGVIGLLVAAIFIIVFCFKKDYTLSCSIDTDTFVSPAFSFDSKSGNSLTKGFFASLKRSEKKTVINIKTKVQKDVAFQMADELGSIIEAIQNGDYDVVEEEAPASV